MYKNLVKPISDFSLALLGLMMLSPLLVFITICLYIFNNGKPFFYQIRPGKNGKLFKIIKFKTMNDKKNDKGQLLPDEKRLTLLGKIIRKTSLDEIPQLINVLKGNMSLIGPRPLLVDYLPLYNKNQNKRHNVKPGITGWAQINGRNAITWKQKFEYDVWYTENITFVLDFKIIFKTIIKVFKSEGISKQNQATTTKFKGNA